MNYVDGYVLVVAKDNLGEYKKAARMCGKIWREHGALEYVECVGDDLDVAKHKMVPFPKMAKAKDGEVVVFAYIVYMSRKDRDSVNKAVMNDPRIKKWMESGKQPPFDPKRMAFGGFKVMVRE